MKFVLLLAVSAFLAVSTIHGQYASILAEQLNQYCETRNSVSVKGNPPRITYRSKAGPIGPPGKVNYTLLDTMITDKLSEMQEWKDEIEILKTENKELVGLFERNHNKSQTDFEEMKSRNGELEKLLNEARENQIQDIGEMKIKMENLERKNRDLENLLNETRENLFQVSKYKDCASTLPILAKSWNISGGVFDIYPNPDTIVEVYCDKTTDGGDWIVFQRRVDDTEDFYRNWDDYVSGFGDKTRNFWLGLENIHLLTSSESYELRVDITHWDGVKRYAKYGSFSVGNAASNYSLDVEGYSGTAGDALKHHNTMAFQTKNKATNHCPKTFKSGWWYKSCYRANLNGVYGPPTDPSSSPGITWRDTETKIWHPLRWVEMKFRSTA